MSETTKGKLTGRKVALIFGGAFAVVLAANITLAVFATGTFSGLVVTNSYVASQGFDRARAAQEDLGWDLAVDYSDGTLHLDLSDQTGQTVRPERLAVTLGRPTTERDDQDIVLAATPSGFASAVSLEPGAWRVEIEATARDGTPFMQRRTFTVRTGE